MNDTTPIFQDPIGVEVAPASNDTANGSSDQSSDIRKNPKQKKLIQKAKIAKPERPLVLVADDDFRFCKSLSETFKSFGFDTIEANDGNAALAIALAKQPDLIVLDTRMPKRSAYLVVEYLRYQSDLQSPILFVSDEEGQRHRKYAKMLGVSEFLEKPIQPDKLVAIASSVLERAKRLRH